MNNEQPTDLHTTKAGINAVNNIFKKWDCTLEEKLAFLGLLESEYNVISDDINTVNLSDDINKRISYILNIYECLHTLHQNPENRLGYLRLKNLSKLFNGSTPMQYIIERGTTEALEDVYGYLDGLKTC